jgi:hypothetical protein
VDSSSAAVHAMRDFGFMVPLWRCGRAWRGMRIPSR